MRLGIRDGSARVGRGVASARTRVTQWEFAVFMRKNVRGTRADVLFSNERRDQGDKNEREMQKRRGVKERERERGNERGTGE